MDIEVTNTGPRALQDVELWVKDVARPTEWRIDSQEPWRVVPLAWPTGEVKINLPPEETRTAQLLYCEDDRGQTILLKGATGVPHRLGIGTLRIELEASSPDAATAKQVFAVKVTSRSDDQKVLELNGDEATALKDAYRRCKEIFNEPGLPWHRIIDLRKVPHRVVSAQVGSKPQTVYDKIANSFIRVDKALDDLPIRREAERRRNPRVKQLEELRAEVGEDLWSTLLTYFPIYERPANIEVESWEEWWIKAHPPTQKGEERCETGGYEIRRDDEINFATGIPDHLGVLLSKVLEILPKLPMTKNPFPEDEIQSWETLAENYIQENLGNTYLVQFRTNAGIQIPTAMFSSEQNRLMWNKLQCRAARLVDMIKELRH